MNPELEQQKETTPGDIDSIVKTLLNVNVNPPQIQQNNANVNISDNISKGYQMIEDIQSNKVDKFQGMKEFLLNLDVITKNVDKSEYQDNIIEDLKKIIAESKNDVMDLIDKAPSTQVISSRLDTILMRIEGALDNKKNNKKESLHFEKIDRLYLKMYDAMQNEEKKKVAFYRGRLIRELKKEKKTISQMYEEVKSLEEINTMLKNDASMDEIKEVLLKEDNKEYCNILSNYLDNVNNFKIEFQKLYDSKEVRRIVLYNNALKEELKNQRIYYDKRYDEEFLGKKGDVLTTLKSFPTAMALSIKSIANSINELKEAKTNKMKIQKTLNTLKEMGKLAVTPVIAAGKFALSNWYTILKLCNAPHPETKETVKKQENSNSQPIKLEKQGPPTKEEALSKKAEGHKGAEEQKIDPGYEKFLEEHPDLKPKNNPYEEHSLEPISDRNNYHEIENEGNCIPKLESGNRNHSYFGYIPGVGVYYIPDHTMQDLIRSKENAPSLIADNEKWPMKAA